MRDLSLSSRSSLLYVLVELVTSVEGMDKAPRTYLHTMLIALLVLGRAAGREQLFESVDQPSLTGKLQETRIGQCGQKYQSKGKWLSELCQLWTPQSEKQIYGICEEENVNINQFHLHNLPHKPFLLHRIKRLIWSYGPPSSKQEKEGIKQLILNLLWSHPVWIFHGPSHREGHWSSKTREMLT